MTTKIILPFLFILALSACKNEKSNRQLFDENLERNVRVCATPFIERGVDSLRAEQLCECLLNFIFEKDSTILFNNNDSVVKDKINRVYDEYEFEMMNRCGITKDSIQ
ncbi:hypothetical protein LJB85_01210 [Porphyromonadaceae bacterium OttesenSCG-928-L07]|nr:hypothetical protein [Porphyromonadaceae bacterium OttesenSCG-928-L07]MDL2251900.1 hypothetical protein [Odoribacter sp. OttesenSCG-928-J03]MDL2283472.1 hypothetical protein [Odoribacter sp. OttesenSCG-928-G04]